MIKKPLRNKLLIAFIVIGLLPYGIFLAYILNFTETKIVNQIIFEQYSKADTIENLINNHMNSLIKDVAFLSKLDLMDDLLAKDIDKRVSRLLTQKAKDYNMDITLFVIDKEDHVVASSDNNNLLTTFTPAYPLNQESGFYIDSSTLYIYSKISASFDAKKRLGTLVMSYNLQNLRQYLTNQKEYHSYIVNEKHTYFIGPKVNFIIDTDKQRGSIINDKNVIVYKKINSVLKDWYIVYAVDKRTALSFLHDFTYFMLILLPFILVGIVFIAALYARKIVKPIEKLTHITDAIIKTQNYSDIVDVTGEDEIARLSSSFNDMIVTTDTALKRLESENKLRLKRFVQLIEIFNTIIQTSSEEECVDISIKYLKMLTKKEDLYFVKYAQSNKSFIPLYVNDFEKNKIVYFGSISLDLKEFDDKNEQQFYTSIATMIALQLDKIRLIQKTISISEAKSSFISHISHEFRTPINAVIGYAQYLISYEELPDEQLDIISNIESSAHYLLNMINEILDIAKIEAGKTDAQVEDTDIALLTQSVFTMLSPLSADKNLDLTLDSTELEGKLFKTDPKLYKQVIINLLSNAIKFTTKGSVDIKLSLQEDKILFSVTDSGVGIAKEDINKLFNDFTQIRNALQSEYKGTGLGLSLSKKIANLLDGDINLTSKGVGHGTTALFYIMIK